MILSFCLICSLSSAAVVIMLIVDPYRGTTYVDHVDPGMVLGKQICPPPFRVLSINAKAELLGPKVLIASQSGLGKILANKSARGKGQLGPANERANNKSAGENGPGKVVCKVVLNATKRPGLKDAINLSIRAGISRQMQQTLLSLI